MNTFLVFAPFAFSRFPLPAPPQRAISRHYDIMFELRLCCRAEGIIAFLEVSRFDHAAGDDGISCSGGG
jgi:hypothetical protein